MTRRPFTHLSLVAGLAILVLLTPAGGWFARSAHADTVPYKSRPPEPPDERRKPDTPDPPAPRPPDKEHPEKRPPEGRQPDNPDTPSSEPQPAPYYSAPVSNGCGNTFVETPPLVPLSRYENHVPPVVSGYSAIFARLRVLEREGFQGQVVLGWPGQSHVDDSGAWLGANLYYSTAAGSTYYDIGAVTMAFTSLAIEKLIETGRLGLATALVDLFPAVPADKRAITIAELLDHTSGLQNTHAAEGEENRERAVQVLLAQSLAHAPGQAFTYSEDGYVILAAAIEIASGMTYERFLTASGVLSADMRETAFWNDTGRLPPAHGNMLSCGECRAHWGRRGDAGIVSSASDLYNWAANNLGRPAFRDFVQMRVHTGVDAGAAFGWFWSGVDSGAPILWMDGQGEFDHNVVVAAYPSGAMIVVTSNRFNGGLPWCQRVVDGLAPILMGSGLADIMPAQSGY